MKSDKGRLKSNEYWRARFALIEESSHKNAEIVRKDIDNAFCSAKRELDDKILAWYQRFAVNNQLSMVEATKLLTSKELSEFKWDVNDYIKNGKENAINGQWIKQLENASAQFHITRLESLKIHTRHSLERVYGKQVSAVGSLLKRNYLGGYYHTAYEVQKGFNIGWDIAAINDKQLKTVLDKPWTADDKTFSARIWGDHRPTLIGSMHAELTRMCLLGKSPDNAIKNISKLIGGNDKKGARFKAGRLVMTESTFFSSAGQKACYEELDVEKFEVVATLDTHTSKICRSLDGHVENMKNYETGVTAPPFHVFCRSTTVPYFNDNFGERAARAEDGKTYYVPSNIKYPDWKKIFADGGSKDGLQKTLERDTVNLQKNVYDLKFEEYMSRYNGISDEYRQVVIERFSQGTDLVKKAFIKNVPDDCIEDFNFIKPSEFNSATRKININSSYDLMYKEIQGDSFFHEHGHLIDNMNSIDCLSIRTKDFRKALQNDYDDYLLQYRKANKVGILAAYGEILTELAGFANINVSDIYSGLSKNKCAGWFKHSNDYWDGAEDSISKEAFAEMFAAHFSPEQYKQTEKYFPKALASFNKILKELI